MDSLANGYTAYTTPADVMNDARSGLGASMVGRSIISDSQFSNSISITTFSLH